MRHVLSLLPFPILLLACNATPCEETIAPSDEVILTATGYLDLGGTYRRTFDQDLTRSSCAEEDAQATVQCDQDGISLVGAVGSLEPVSGSDDPNGSVWMEVHLAIGVSEPGTYDGADDDSEVLVKFETFFVQEDTITSREIQITEVSADGVQGTYDMSWTALGEGDAQSAWFSGPGAVSGAFTATCLPAK